MDTKRDPEKILGKNSHLIQDFCKGFSFRVISLTISYARYQIILGGIHNFEHDSYKILGIIFQASKKT